MKLDATPRDRQRVLVEEHSIAGRVRGRDEAVLLEVTELLVGDPGRFRKLRTGQDDLGLRQPVDVGRGCRREPSRSSPARHRNSAARRVVSKSGSPAAALPRRFFGGALPSASDVAAAADLPGRVFGSGAPVSGTAPLSISLRRSLITLSGRKCFTLLAQDENGGVSTSDG